MELLVVTFVFATTILSVPAEAFLDPVAVASPHYYGKRAVAAVPVDSVARPYYGKRAAQVAYQGLLEEKDHFVGKRSAAKIAAVQTMIEGGKTLTETVEKLIDKVVSPSLMALDKEIKKIDTTIEGLDAEEKKLVTEATTSLYNTRSSMFTIKLTLNALADETITVASRLKRYVAKCSEGMPENKIKRIIGKAAEQMCHILKRSDAILEEAKNEYNRCDRAMNSIKANLEAFVKSVVALKDGQDGRLQKWKDSTRAAVYGTLGVTLLAGPLAVAAYATAAGILETKIAEYDAALDRLLKKCDKSAGAARNLISETDKTKEFIQTEQKLIQAWESSLTTMAVDFKNADTVVENLYLFGSEMNEMNGMLDNLITACSKYKAHAMQEGMN